MGKLLEGGETLLAMIFCRRFLFVSEREVLFVFSEEDGVTYVFTLSCFLA